MTTLRELECVPIRGGEPTVTDAEIAQFGPQVPGWRIVEVDGVRRLEHVFSFTDFAQALAFTNQVGKLAESQGHHPSVLTEWGKVTVAWWTHKIKGLHRNDFIMAAKTNQILDSQ